MCGEHVSTQREQIHLYGIHNNVTITSTHTYIYTNIVTDTQTHTYTLVISASCTEMRVCLHRTRGQVAPSSTSRCVVQTAYVRSGCVCVLFVRRFLAIISCTRLEGDRLFHRSYCLLLRAQRCATAAGWHCTTHNYNGHSDETVCARMTLPGSASCVWLMFSSGRIPTPNRLPIMTYIVYAEHTDR